MQAAMLNLVRYMLFKFTVDQISNRFHVMALAVKATASKLSKMVVALNNNHKNAYCQAQPLKVYAVEIHWGSAYARLNWPRNSHTN